MATGDALRLGRLMPQGVANSGDMIIVSAAGQGFAGCPNNTAAGACVVGGSKVCRRQTSTMLLRRYAMGAVTLTGPNRGHRLEAI